MEKSTEKKPETVKVWALTPEQADELWGKTDDEIRKALGKESYQNLKDLMDGANGDGANGMKLKELADSIGMTPSNVRKGVQNGSQFREHPGAFDKMCRLLGFDPSKAGEVLGGIYDEPRRREVIDARMHASAAMMEMHDLYDQIKDPTDKQIAEAGIYALWRQLKLLAERQG